MTIDDTSGSLAWAHVGDLHITREGEANYRDFLSIIASINAHLAGQIDFCVLPGDNADDGSAAQYALIRRGRSTGQVEEGPVGFSLVSLTAGVVSWRFKPLQSPWPFGMITSPADSLAVEAADELGNTDRDSIVVAAPVHHPPPRTADGSDADAIGEWRDRHLLGTRLGPNRNGRQW